MEETIYCVKCGKPQFTVYPFSSITVLPEHRNVPCKQCMYGATKKMIGIQKQLAGLVGHGTKGKKIKQKNRNKYKKRVR